MACAVRSCKSSYRNLKDKPGIVSFHRFEKPDKFIIFMAPKSFTANNIFIDERCPRPKSKRQFVSKLRKDLGAACLVAKTLENVKKKETTSLRIQLKYARDECEDLLQIYNNNINIIGTLHKQNESLQSKLNNLTDFIQLGYRELKKIKIEDIEEPTTLAQLKKLIQSCGQYYADYCNENEMCLKMKQNNRFLKNKISILENNIQAIKEQLKALEYRNLRLVRENTQIKGKYEKYETPKSLNFKVAYSEVKLGQSIEEHKDYNEIYFQDSGDYMQGKDFNLTTHLEIVNRLLSDQDTLLQDLTLITKEMSLN